MIERHKTYYFKDFTPINFCGKTVMYKVNVSEFEIPFEIEPTIGEHDYTKCEACQLNVKKLTEILNEKFVGNELKRGFPYCCKEHANLVKVKEFDRISFLKVPEMTARKVIYTNQHIINNLNTDNWYKKISDYIEWVVESFGQMPENCGEQLFLSAYFHFIKQPLDTKNTKQKKILDFIEAYRTPKQSSDTDVNILLRTYEEWLKEFPFELESYFGHLKQFYQRQLPIFLDKPELNMYSGKAKAIVHTKKSLFKELINLTNDLLTRISGVTLYEQGIITDIDKMKLELIISSRKLKLRQGYKSTSLTENIQFRKMIKEWFKDEKRFLNDLAPLAKNLPPVPKNIEQTPNKPSKTKQLISEELETIDKNGWEYAFKNETDYNTFLDLLTNYFEYNPYELPQQRIKLTRDCKTRLAKVFNIIHKKLSEKPLKSDTEFFQIIRVLNHFENLSDIEIYQAITK